MVGPEALCCPCSEKSDLLEEDDGFRCAKSECPHHSRNRMFRKIDGVPVLISDLKCDTVCDPANTASYIARPSQRTSRGRIKKLLIGVSRVTKRNCRDFIDAVLRKNPAPKVLVIGSGEKGSGTEDLYDNAAIDITGIDIYRSDTVDIICDGHYLPFRDGTFDGVWIQTVLHLVVEPQVVVSEIHRVLSDSGIVYAETGFMQQVHEGPYDFGRFTVLGHRYLFRDFEAIRFGAHKGPDVALAWSVRYFVWATTRSRKLARAVGVATGLLLRPFRFLIAEPAQFDSASEVFFLGRKSKQRLRHKDMPGLYQGMYPNAD